MRRTVQRRESGDILDDVSDFHRGELVEDGCSRPDGPFLEELDSRQMVGSKRANPVQAATSSSLFRIFLSASPRCSSTAAEGLLGTCLQTSVVQPKRMVEMPTFLSVYDTATGPSPFHRIRLISRFFSSPVSSSTTIVSTEAGLAL